MNPQSTTVGQRLGRKLNNALLIPAARRSPDPVAFAGGYLASIAGGVAGILGPQVAAELLRIALGHLEKQPQLALPPGVRLQIAAAEQAGAIAPDAVDEAEALEAIGTGAAEQRIELTLEDLDPADPRRLHVDVEAYVARWLEDSKREPDPAGAELVDLLPGILLNLAIDLVEELRDRGVIREAPIAQALARDANPCAALEEQLECMRRVLATLAVRARLADDELVGLLNQALEDVRAGRPPAPR